ncbi:MAG: hypothetical protein LUG51_08695 [Tannerellaceae bacterium]|nr:hypothetical protein [Tannerellaceae bacterium]
MRKQLLLSLMIGLLLPVYMAGQSRFKPDATLVRQLEESRFLRLTMKPELQDAGLTRWKKKEVFASRDLGLVDNFSSLQLLAGPGELHIDRERTISGKGSVRLDVPTSTKKKESYQPGLCHSGSVVATAGRRFPGI